MLRASHAFAACCLCLLSLFLATAGEIDNSGNGALTSLNIKDNSIEKEGKAALGNALLKSNVQFMVCDEWSVTLETLSLDVGSKKLAAADAVLLAGVISTNGALTSIDMNNNGDIPNDLAEAIYQPVRMNKLRFMTEDKSLTELDISGIGFGPEGALVVADYIKNNGALKSLDISRNNIGQIVPLKDAPQGWAEHSDAHYKGWFRKKGDTGQWAQGLPEGAIAIAGAISTNGALVRFTFSGDDKHNGKPVTIESSTIEADFSGKVLQASGAIMLAAFLPKCRYVHQEYPLSNPC